MQLISGCAPPALPNDSLGEWAFEVSRGLPPARSIAGAGPGSGADEAAAEGCRPGWIVGLGQFGSLLNFRSLKSLE